MSRSSAGSSALIDIDASELVQIFNGEFVSYDVIDLTNDVISCASRYLSTIFTAQHFCLAIRENEEEKLSHMIEDERYSSLFTELPRVISFALAARNMRLVDTILSARVPETWKEKRYSRWTKTYSDTSAGTDEWLLYTRALRHACYWNRPDIVRRLMSYHET